MGTSAVESAPPSAVVTFTKSSEWISPSFWSHTRDSVSSLYPSFVVTTTFKRAEGIFASRLPRDAGTPAATLPISPIVIRVSQEDPSGRFCRIRIDNFARAPQTFDELAQFLVDVQANPGFDRDTPVVIFPTPDVRWDHVVNCWNAAVRAKCTTITFAGQ